MRFIVFLLGKNGVERWKESGWIVKMEGKKKTKVFPDSLLLYSSNDTI